MHSYVDSFTTRYLCALIRYSIDINDLDLSTKQYVYYSILLRNPEYNRVQQTNIGTGFRFVLVTKYLSLSLRYSTYTMMIKPHVDTIGIHLFYEMFTLHTYNHRNLYAELYHVYTFLYNIGRCSGTFMTLSKESLVVDAIALDYFIMNLCGRKRFIEDRFYFDRMRTLKLGASSTIRDDVDFILIVDSRMSEGAVTRMRAMQLHVIGMSSDVTWGRYVDTVIPLDTVSGELQYFFMEMCLYAYLHGRRAGTVSDMQTVVSVAKELLI